MDDEDETEGTVHDKTEDVSQDGNRTDYEYETYDDGTPRFEGMTLSKSVLPEHLRPQPLDRIRTE
jgi:hypothetical protein